MDTSKTDSTKLSDRECAERLKTLRVPVNYVGVLEFYPNGSAPDDTLPGPGYDPRVVINAGWMRIGLRAPKPDALDPVRRGTRETQKSPADAEALVQQHRKVEAREADRIRHLEVEIQRLIQAGHAADSDKVERLKPSLRRARHRRYAAKSTGDHMEYVLYGDPPHLIDADNACFYPETCIGPTCLSEQGCAMRPHREPPPPTPDVASPDESVDLSRGSETAPTGRPLAPESLRDSEVGKIRAFERWVWEEEQWLEYKVPIDLRRDTDERRALLNRMLSSNDNGRSKTVRYINSQINGHEEGGHIGGHRRVDRALMALVAKLYPKGKEHSPVSDFEYWSPPPDKKDVLRAYDRLQRYLHVLVTLRDQGWGFTGSDEH